MNADVWMAFKAIKLDEYLEKFQREGGGSFSIQKFILQILGTLNSVFEPEIEIKE